MQDIGLTPRPENSQILDINIVEGDLQIINEIDALVQKIIIKLKFFFAEWYLDTTKGIKYYESILVKNPDINLIENIFKAAIIEEDEITRIVEFKTDYDVVNRLLSIDFIADSIYGEINLEEEFTL